MAGAMKSACCTRSFGQMTHSLRQVAGTAQQIAAGDLRNMPQPQSPEDQLGTSLATMVGNLRRMTGDVTEAANVLGSSTRQIAASTSQLASSAAETATSVAETTATVAEVRQTARGGQPKGPAGRRQGPENGGHFADRARRPRRRWSMGWPRSASRCRASPRAWSA